MASGLDSERGWRAHELLGALPFAWAAFHLWEQWPAFAGRGALSARLATTSHGALAIGVELLLAILPAVAWIVLDVRLRTGGPEPSALAHAMSENETIALRLGWLVRVCSWLFFGWVLYHAAWLWLPKILEGSEPARTWLRLRDGMGTWLHASLHAVGLTAFAVHSWASVPRLTVALGWAPTAEGRRAARLSGAIMSLGLLLLYAQLAGWHAAGTGTVWGLD